MTQLETTTDELETKKARLREHQGPLRSRKRAELAAQQDHLEARSRELAEKAAEVVESCNNAFCDPGRAGTTGFLGALQGLRGTPVRSDAPGLGPALECMRADLRQSQKQRSP